MAQVIYIESLYSGKLRITRRALEAYSQRFAAAGVNLAAIRTVEDYHEAVGRFLDHHFLMSSNPRIQDPLTKTLMTTTPRTAEFF